MPRLLLVDDEAILRSLIAEYFSDVGFDVVQAEDLGSALVQVAGAPFDCVVCDVRMPDGTGFDLARHVLETRPDTKIVLISGHTDTMPIHLQKRGVRLFSKPLAMDDMVAHVQELCRASSRHP